MNCDKCPHMQKIKSALLPCQTCEAGKLMHTCSLDATAKSIHALEHRKPSDHTQSTGVTNLSPEDEDKLRIAMSTLFSLKPIDLLLVQHIFSGNPLSTFGDTLITVERKIKHYHGTIRSMAQAKKDTVSTIFPKLAPLLGEMVKENATPKFNRGRGV